MSNELNMMTRRQLLAKVQTAFAASELFTMQLIERDGAKVWQYLDTDLLRVLVWLRFSVLNVPLVCNTKTLQQRGFRDNLCPIVAEKTAAGRLYVSPHMLGRGVDLSSQHMTAEEMRKRIKENAAKVPCNIRVERDVNWLHVDTIDTGMNVYFFKA